VNRQKFLDKLSSQAHTAQAQNAGSPTATLRARNSYSPEKRRQLEESLSRTISSLTLTDGLKLIDQAFAKLGI
jgi:hypothetical protein